MKSNPTSPAAAIIGDPALRGKRILLAVGGGIAAYKAVEIMRLLQKAGASVQVLMTRSAQEFVRPLTFQTLSGNPVASDLFDLTEESQIGHIRLARDSNLILVAPATANRIARAAWGFADDLLSTVLAAATVPVVMAPAMNVEMWNHLATQANCRTLENRGVILVPPGSGDLACGETGAGRLAEPDAIVEAVASSLTAKLLKGVRVLVTAGPTREAIDPVRFLSNRSSGKMGYAMAQMAARHGAEVTLVSGPVAISPPAGVKLVQTTTAAEMHEAVMAGFRSADIVVKAAAVSDYRPAEPARHKLKRREKEMPVIDLEPTTDILKAIGAAKRGQYLVGFAAETHDLADYARAKLREKNLDLLVANDVSRSDAGFDTDTNAVTLFSPDGKVEELPFGSKLEVAAGIWQRILRHYQKPASRQQAKPDAPARGKPPVSRRPVSSRRRNGS